MAANANGVSIEQVNPLGSQSIGRPMMKYSDPAIIGMLVTALYNMVGQIFIGWGIKKLKALSLLDKNQYLCLNAQQQ